MIVAIFNGTRRDGMWSARSTETVVTIFGGVRIDYSQAILPPGAITLRVFALFGGAHIRVPANAAVTPEGVAIFGGFGVRRYQDRAGDPREAKPFFIGGVAIFSGVQIEQG